MSQFAHLPDTQILQDAVAASSKALVEQENLRNAALACATTLAQINTARQSLRVLQDQQVSASSDQIVFINTMIASFCAEPSVQNYYAAIERTESALAFSREVYTEVSRRGLVVSF